MYVEDQYLWSSRVAAVLADALRREPSLRMVAVLPAHLDPDQGAQAQAQASSQRRALAELRRAGGDRFEVYAPENHEGRPVYVHAKVCVVDDVWVSVGSANINRRSWTHDSELTAAVLDRTPDHRGPSDTPGEPGRRFARDLRVQLWCEHLDRDEHDVTDLVDPDLAPDALRQAAHALDLWHTGGRVGPRPPGRLRPYAAPTLATPARWWAPPISRLLTDPDGHPHRQ